MRVSSGLERSREPDLLPALLIQRVSVLETAQHPHQSDRLARRRKSLNKRHSLRFRASGSAGKSYSPLLPEGDMSKSVCLRLPLPCFYYQGQREWSCPILMVLLATMVLLDSIERAVS